MYRNGEHRSAGSVHIGEGSMRNMLQDAANMLSGPVSSFYTVEGTKMVEVGVLCFVVHCEARN